MAVSTDLFLFFALRASLLSSGGVLAHPFGVSPKTRAGYDAVGLRL